MDAATQVALLAQLQLEVQTLQAAVAVPPVALPFAPVFTLAPALASAATYLDLTSASATKHFKGATGHLDQGPFDFPDPPTFKSSLTSSHSRNLKCGAGTLSLLRL
jgi:hypothetical protein